MASDAPDDRLAERVFQQTEVRLAAQLDVALAADMRAITSATLLIGLAAAALGFCAANFEGEQRGLAFGAGTTGAVLLFAALLCLAAAWPKKFDLTGNLSSNWWEDGVEKRSYADCLRREAGNYDKRIRRNRDVIAVNARLFQGGMWVALAAPILGFLAWRVNA